jgi:hypothetical protein
MRRGMVVMIAFVLLSALGGPGWATVFTVSNRNDSGVGSLRWAIEQANTHTAPDVVTFAPGVAGKVIRPITPLPALTDPQTTIDGDLNDDGAPDVAVNGTQVSGGSGLVVQAGSTVVEGLAVTNFPEYGIRVEGADAFRLRSCHLGVSLAGTAAVPNRWYELRLLNSTAAVIGGRGKRRNIIGTGGGPSEFGIVVTGGGGNYIRGNYFGLTRDGMSALVPDPAGAIKISGPPTPPTLVNTIGGDSAGTGNVFGRLSIGVRLTGAQNTRIIGNSFGLMADGSTLTRIDYGGIYLESASTTANLIGDRKSGCRNVFAGGTTGIRFVSAGPANKVQGNWFGTNAAGTARRRLITGVNVTAGAGSQLIGGSAPGAGNYFAPNHPAYSTQGCYLIGDNGTTVRGNYFGVLPNGRAAPVYVGVNLQTGATVRDNRFVRCNTGISEYGGAANGRIFGNTFRDCSFAVALSSYAHANLGNLGNQTKADDGGNIFKPGVFRCIDNKTPNPVKAEGNDFGTTSRAAINARIWDQRDDGSLGRVDFRPLIGGVLPTAHAETADNLAVTSATAVPTSAGAEIVFSLSAPAEVTVLVLNVAGRPVATPARAVGLAGGTQRVAWDGRTHTGTTVPAGAYVIRITARGASGQEATSLTALRLTR